MNYSQNFEQEHILKYFGDFVGTFLSCGENDGETFSNVRALALRNWSGVMVEPSPTAFARLKQLYEGHKGFYVYPFAIGSHNGKATLQESGSLVSPKDTGLVSTFVPAEQDRFRRIVKYAPIEVKMFRWKTFLNRLKIKKFDFVAIDCEGLDLEILSQMDLTEVKAIVLEWNGKPELKTEFEKYLDGFKLLYSSGENLLYGR
jgi:FkbM family methyltransferase